MFVTSSGKPRDRHNLRQRVVAPIVRKADELLATRDIHPLPTGLSPHKLKHTFASLVVALGNDPGDSGEREALKALVEGAATEWDGSSGGSPSAVSVGYGP